MKTSGMVIFRVVMVAKKIKYNLKWILIEKDDIEIVDVNISPAIFHPYVFDFMKAHGMHPGTDVGRAFTSILDANVLEDVSIDADVDYLKRAYKLSPEDGQKLYDTIHKYGNNIDDWSMLNPGKSDNIPGFDIDYEEEYYENF